MDIGVGSRPSDIIFAKSPLDMSNPYFCPPSRCLPRTCGLLRALPNGDIECRNGGVNSTTAAAAVDTVCVASCRPGYRLGGSREAIQLKNIIGSNFGPKYQ